MQIASFIYYYHIQFTVFKSSGASKGVDQDLKWFIPVILKWFTHEKSPKSLESLFPIQNSTDYVFSVVLVGNMIHCGFNAFNLMIY